jgi:hypothetical protein
MMLHSAKRVLCKFLVGCRSVVSTRIGTRHPPLAHDKVQQELESCSKHSFQLQ